MDNNLSQTNCYSEVQLLDGVTESLLSFDDWVAQELRRISLNQSPLNCSNFEALLTVIEGTSHAGQYSIYNSNTSQLVSNQVSGSNKVQVSTFDDIKDSISVSNVGNPGHILTQNSLVQAFINLINGCQHEPFHSLLKNHRKPIKLLMELENASEMASLWRNANPQKSNQEQKEMIADVKDKLAQVVFSNHIPFFHSWTTIGLWVQQEHCVLDQRSGWEWLEFGTVSYLIAKRMCNV